MHVPIAEALKLFPWPGFDFNESKWYERMSKIN